MAQPPPKKGWLRISALAKKAGVPAATIKHYLQEGLLPRPVKTGKTMAYYDPACVDRIRRIKKLQRDRFLPLDVIRRVIDSNGDDAGSLAFGEALAESHGYMPDGGALAEDEVIRRTGLTRHRLRKMERLGLTSPETQRGRRVYDHHDIEIIGIARDREDMGLPFDFSIRTMRLYRDAMETAVRKDARRFISQILGDMPAGAAADIIRRADADLDRFVIHIRRKLLRAVSRAAVAELNTLADRLAPMIFLHIPGRRLPDEPPAQPFDRMVYHMIRDEYHLAAGLAARPVKRKPPLRVRALGILATLYEGRTGEALRMAEAWMPAPVSSPLENLPPGLAYVFAATGAPGFVKPIQLMRRALEYLTRAESRGDPGTLASVITRYVCGAVYTALPGILDLGGHGWELLAAADRDLKKIYIDKNRHPDWMAETLKRELVPELTARLRLMRENNE